MSAENSEAWRELAVEARVAVMDYWTHEHERKSEVRMLRVVRILDKIQELERREARP